MHLLRVIVIGVLFTFTVPIAGEAASVAVLKTDKCPVCGMFVAKYPDFLARIIFTDGSYAVFDGVKDLFKYYFSINKYNAAKELADIASISVTDYYSMNAIDGRKSWYVIGSDVYGPMGRELIPFEKETDATVFGKDHAGKKIVRFDDVTPDMIKELD